MVNRMKDPPFPFWFSDLRSLTSFCREGVSHSLLVFPRLSDSFERRQKTSRSFWEQLWTNFCGWEQLTNCSTFFFPRGCPGNKACTLTFHSTYARDTGGGVGGGGLCGREIMWETDKALLPGDPQEHTSLSFFLRMWLVTAHHPDSWAASTIGN